MVAGAVFVPDANSQRLPLVDDYWLDLDEAADTLAALVESTAETEE